MPADKAPRRRIVRDALAVGLAVGAYGLPFGALATTAGLTVAQTQFMSLFLYSGASQFAMVGVLATGGGGVTAAATSAMLGTRNLFYSVGLAPMLGFTRGRRLAGAHVVSDESAAMAVGQPDPPLARYAFWVTGGLVLTCWNVGTLVGSLAGSVLTDPRSLGLDAASSAAFLALVAPRLKNVRNRPVALLGALFAIAATPFLMSGLPIVVAALATCAVLLAVPTRKAVG